MCPLLPLLLLVLLALSLSRSFVRTPLSLVSLSVAIYRPLALSVLWLLLAWLAQLSPSYTCKRRVSLEHSRGRFACLLAGKRALLALIREREARD